MPRSDTTLIALIESAVNGFGDRTAYRCMGVDTSFAQFGRDSARVRNALQEWQLPSDARVAVMLPNVA
ncbi:MAG: long-chain fatty acid--CoA ligase, partial [Burkholderiaceae bacterium]